MQGIHVTLIRYLSQKFGFRPVFLPSQMDILNPRTGEFNENGALSKARRLPPCFVSRCGLSLLAFQQVHRGIAGFGIGQVIVSHVRWPFATYSTFTQLWEGVWASRYPLPKSNFDRLFQVYCQSLRTGLSATIVNFIEKSPNVLLRFFRASCGPA